MEGYYPRRLNFWKKRALRDILLDLSPDILGGLKEKQPPANEIK
jgi:hypothetical protein